MKWFLMLEGIEMGIFLIVLIAFSVPNCTIMVNEHVVSWPFRIIVIALSATIIICLAQSFKE